MATTRRLSRLERLLLDHQLVKPAQLEAARQRQRGAQRPLLEVLLEQGGYDEGRLMQLLVEATGLPFLAAEELEPDPAVQELISGAIAQRFGILPLRREGKRLLVATSDPYQLVTFDELAAVLQLRLKLHLAAPSALRQLLRTHRAGEEILDDLIRAGNLDGSLDQLRVQQLDEDDPFQSLGGITITVGGREEARSQDVGADDEGSPASRLVSFVLADAIRKGASDVHIEAEQENLRVRLRVDGVLRDVLRIPASLHAPVIRRLKVLTGLDTIEQRRPQDGRAKVELVDKKIDLRISTLPAYFGEKAVLRLLDPQAASFDLDQTGLEGGVLSRWRQLCRQPNGLLLVTGPTGSGKTSTLYATILELRDPALNIVTVEDPVEYQFPGIVHVPVRSDIGMTFAAGLRSILRQDPDVILLGEIRDGETAATALRASATGHLVLSTLHTNDATAALGRLLDLDTDPQMLASSLRGIMAQRLVRTICPDCSRPVDDFASGLLDLEPFGPIRTDEELDLRRGRGCGSCFGAGLRGRTAIAELVVPSPELRDKIAARASEGELRRQARLDGTASLAEAGREKIVAGRCTAQEVLRVVQPERRPAKATRPVQPQSEPVAQASCPACQAELDPAWKLCPFCGEAVTQEPLGIVVCDDDPTVRLRLLKILERAELGRVAGCVDGQEALALISREKPRLLVVDHFMPGLTGVEVIRMLRTQLETALLPVVMLTSCSEDELEAIALEAGADDYLTKPVQPVRLLARIKALLRTRDRLQQAA